LMRVLTLCNLLNYKLPVKEKNTDFSYAAQFAVNLCDTIVQQGGLPLGTLLNVNVPNLKPEQIKGVRVARQARFHHADVYEKRTDPFERTYYWLRLEKVLATDPPEDEVDYRLLKEGYVVVCPIQYDLTDYQMLAQLKKWRFDEQKTALNTFFS